MSSGEKLKFSSRAYEVTSTFLSKPQAPDIFAFIVGQQLKLEQLAHPEAPKPERPNMIEVIPYVFADRVKYMINSLVMDDHHEWGQERTHVVETTLLPVADGEDVIGIRDTDSGLVVVKDLGPYSGFFVALDAAVLNEEAIRFPKY